MVSIKHTEFMGYIAKHIAPTLPQPYQDRLQYGEARWLCQVYLGKNRRIHYEVSRPYNRQGRQLEIGLHFEQRGKKNDNRRLVTQFDRYLFQIRDELGESVKAEYWDKGWGKLYSVRPDETLTKSLAVDTTQRLAEFIKVVQPIYDVLEQKGSI